jgi:DNA-binding NtrC family response regulator
LPDLLIVEDKHSLRTVLRKTVEAAGYTVEEAADGEQALSLLARRRYLAILCDLKLPGADGFGVLRAALEADPAVPVILMTAYGTIEDAVRAMKDGAYDFLAKPVDTDHLLLLVERSLAQRRLFVENLVLREEFAQRVGLPRILGESPAIHEASGQLQKVAGTDATVLLLGESGTGKELFARAIHHLSPRSGGPFVALNCAAIPENLLENELFGHERGAYTGADRLRVGKLEMASGGTLFLDEIGEMPPGMQGKILRVLQERSFERVGGNLTLEADVRVVAATNRDLESAAARGEFREDLFFRLSVFPLTVPPLRRRREDIPLLARYFLERFAREMHRPVQDFHPEALERLQAYAWPGNVRELQNCIERAVILCDGQELAPEHLELRGGRAGGEGGLTVEEIASRGGSLAEVASRAAAEAERIRIRHALQEAQGSRTRAAEILQVSTRTLSSRLKDLGLEEEGRGEGAPVS